MSKFGDLGSQFSKTNIRFEICIFEIGFRQNFVKIRKLILFGPKYLHFGIWARNFQKPMSNLKSVLSK